MSLKEDILEQLQEYDIQDIEIDKNHVENGVPATKIKIVENRDGHNFYHLFTFAHSLKLNGFKMGHIIGSYMSNEYHLGEVTDE